MKKFFRAWAAGVAAGLLLWASTAAAKEEEIPLDKLPKPVVDAVRARFPHAELVEAAKETEDDETIYEVALKHKGKSYDVSLTPEGKITEIERAIEFKELPKPAAKAIEGKYPKATVKMTEEVTKDDKVTYEALIVTTDKKTLEVVFDPQGKFIEEEQKGGEKD